MNGYLIIDKPAGFTSFDVVNKLKRLLQTKKIGHGGTLDPMVTGVLPVFVGNATRAIPLIPDGDKTYECTMILGVTTDTEDMTGTVLSEKEVTAGEDRIREVMQSFTGPYLQTPPMYSAKKVNGKKLYELARKGIETERMPELRTVYSITVDEIALPRVRFTAKVSRGTYIRTLCRDAGERIGSGGTMDTLRRTVHGRFSLSDAVTLKAVEDACSRGEAASLLRPAEELFPDAPVLTVSEAGDRFLANGNPLTVRNFGFETPDACPEEAKAAELVRIRRSDGEFGGLYRFSGEDGEFVPVRIFSA